MKITSIRTTEELNDRLNEYVKQYNQKSIAIFLEMVLKYIERNKIDLNHDLNISTYDTIKEFDKTIKDYSEKTLERIEEIKQENNKQMIQDAKRLEHLISVVKNIEKEYFFPLKEQGLLKVATEREMKEDLKYKDLFENLINKISSIYSTKRQMDVFLVDISKTEFNILKDYARKF